MVLPIQFILAMYETYGGIHENAGRYPAKKPLAVNGRNYIIIIIFRTTSNLVITHASARTHAHMHAHTYARAHARKRARTHANMNAHMDASKTYNS